MHNADHLSDTFDCQKIEKGAYFHDDDFFSHLQETFQGWGLGKGGYYVIVLLEAYSVIFQGATTRQGIVLCVLVVLLYVSRVIYNLIAVTVPHDLSSFGYGWINISDEVSIDWWSDTYHSADSRS